MNKKQSVAANGPNACINKASTCQQVFYDTFVFSDSLFEEG